MKHLTYYSNLCLILLTISCNSESSQDINKNIDTKEINSFFIESDTITTVSSNGNFRQNILINDSLYIWTWGNDSVRVTIDTIRDGNVSSYNIIWESQDMLGLEMGCGTNCWSNRIINLSNPDIISTYSYSAFDTACMNVVEIEDNMFRFTNLISGNSIIIENNYYDHRPDGFSQFYIEIIEFSHTKITYEIVKEKDERIRLVLNYNLDCKPGGPIVFY